MQKRVSEHKPLNGSVYRFETDSYKLAVSGLSQTLSSPGSLTHIVIHHQNEVHSCCSVLPCAVQAGSNSDYAEATPLPNQRSSFKLFPYLSRLFSLNAFADLLCLFLSLPLSLSLSPQNLFSSSSSLSCSGVRFPASATRGSVASSSLLFDVFSSVWVGWG